MAERKKMIVDGNGAVAHVAHATNEVIAIYPITPSSPMGEICDEKTTKGEKNIWGTIPKIAEMQSEGGAAAAVHGALTMGAMSTTFTASQGLLLMIPNMYKIAGELTPTVFHIAARAIACQALNIFGDHSDVMACRMTGWAMLASSNVQEAEDFALISQAATLEARVPFIHFFEGFRVSHEIQKIEEITFDDMKAMLDDKLVKEHRKRGLTPDNPAIRGTSQNPDVYFQGREVANEYYNACPDIVQKYMDKFASIIGRQYHLFDYVGAPDAENIIVVMGSGAEVIHETVDYLNKKGEKVGLLKVRLFRPWKTESFINALPESVKKIAVLDRTKEPGSLGEPLYEDVRTAIGEAMENKNGKLKSYPKIVGGRFGLGSAEFTPAMVKAIYDNLKQDSPKNHFIVGINDDLTNTSLEVDEKFDIEDNDTYQAMFYGLGSDGTVGANKNSIKIIASKTDNYAQGYFEYDSKKAGAMTVSHLRFGKNPIRSPYLITKANFIACHNFSFLEKYDMLSNAKENGTFLLISTHDKNEVWQYIPNRVQKQIIDKKLNFYIINANKIAKEVGLGSRVNVIMQTAFFEISKVIEPTIAITAIKDAIKKTYGKKGDAIVNMNISAVDKAITAIEKVDVPANVSGNIEDLKSVPENSPEFVKNLTAKLLKREGTSVKTSEMPVDGTWPTGTTQYEKRNIAISIPEWNSADCIQCGRCSLVCPHAAIRMKVYDEKELENAPKNFKSANAIGKDVAGKKCTIQIAPEDCAECGLCMASCPIPKPKEALKWVNQESVREQEIENFDFFLNKLPEVESKLADRNTLKGTQLVKPLFEFSGACAGCGETGYVKLLSQLFGDRLMIANATGCSSIYGGNLPTTPYTTRKDGRGPAWSNSLFEDNAEFALGMRITYDKYKEFALELVDKMLNEGCSCSDDCKCIENNKDLLNSIKLQTQNNQQEIEEMREKVSQIKSSLKNCTCEECKQLYSLADYLVKKSVWALGGDGWAYDIGYGGLDHVLASGENIKVLVLDTEVYSNTGGQASKSTPIGAVAKFASSGKKVGKKDLAMMAMSYGYVYVAKVSIGADPNQLIKAMNEAENYDGPAIVIAYAHCVAHGINMNNGLEEQKKAVASGHWQLFRYNPDLALKGENPLKIDSKAPTMNLADYVYGENRYKILQKMDPETSAKLIEEADKLAKKKYEYLKKMSEI
jgi:pyruvate-ferredoxin/flavodoxin oxidoreductase